MNRESDLDGACMDRALELAARAYGGTSPNPLVEIAEAGLIITQIVITQIVARSILQTRACR